MLLCQTSDDESSSVNMSKRHGPEWLESQNVLGC